MSWLDRILPIFRPAPSPSPGPSPRPAPGGTPLREAAGFTVDPDEDAWRPLGTDARRDLAPMDQRRMQDLAAHLWEGEHQ